jgi:hypothetical protein
MSTYSDIDSYDFKDVRFDTIIDVQSEFCENLLNNILEKLKDDENNHREKFMNNKLVDCFHSSLSYIFTLLSR